MYQQQNQTHNQTLNVQNHQQKQQPPVPSRNKKPSPPRVYQDLPLPLPRTSYTYSSKTSPQAQAQSHCLPSHPQPLSQLQSQSPSQSPPPTPLRPPQLSLSALTNSPHNYHFHHNKNGHSHQRLPLEPSGEPQPSPDLKPQTHATVSNTLEPNTTLSTLTDDRETEVGGLHPRSSSVFTGPEPSHIEAFEPNSRSASVYVGPSSYYQTKQETLVGRGVSLFNSKPQKGLDYLQQNNLLGTSPQEIARFLVSSDVSPTKLGEYLGELESVPILKAFTEEIDLSNLEFDVALRKFLSKFRLPGEAQKIDRMMEAFAERFYSLNTNGMFATPDAAYVLAFSLIMLNTDAHNPSIRKQDKMTKQQFVRNNNGINNNKNVDQPYLEALYDNIVREKIKLPEGLFVNAEKKGWLIKQGGKIKTWKKRWFVLSRNCLFYFKSDDDPEPCGIIPLENLVVARASPRSTTRLSSTSLPADSDLDHNNLTLNQSQSLGTITNNNNNNNNTTHNGHNSQESNDGPEKKKSDMDSPGRGKRSLLLKNRHRYLFTLSPATASASGELMKSCKIQDGVVVQGNHSQYAISAGTEEEMQEWMEAIESYIHKDPFFDLLEQKKQRLRQNTGTGVTVIDSRPQSFSQSRQSISSIFNSSIRTPSLDHISSSSSSSSTSNLGSKSVNISGNGVNSPLGENEESFIFSPRPINPHANSYTNPREKRAVSFSKSLRQRVDEKRKFFSHEPSRERDVSHLRSLSVDNSPATEGKGQVENTTQTKSRTGRRASQSFKL